MRAVFVLLILSSPAILPAEDRPDIVFQDFEGDSYGKGWKTSGAAFGSAPAKGTLPGQMAVTGYLGKGLVNSFVGGDDSTGTLTSPTFKIERKYINFLIGGGKHPGKACINLLVGGKVVRTATGPNDRPGGSERLDWHSWNVAEFENREATIEIVDMATGGWGHINVDHIVQSDQRKQAEPILRTMKIDRPYLHLPVKNGAPQKRVRFLIDDAVVREFDIELDESGTPDYWTFASVSQFQGKTLTVEATLADARPLNALRLSDDVPDAATLYREKHRPLFHFTSRRGWLNDPNGLVHANGEWHLFYQHNPFGVQWGNMHWGHAVSKDLVHWNELDIALYPRQYGDFAFSGSAVLDVNNTSGWGTKERPPVVLAYTSTGRGECIAHSNDDGRTWREYDKNPVVRHSGRDPKLVWHEKARHWVMAVYDEFQGKQWIAFHTSPDLKTWTFASRIEGFYECPDLFEIAFEDALRSKWVLYAADGKYVLGEFDGKQFVPDTREKKQLWYGRFYAAQTYDSAPVDQRKRPRRVQVGWASGVTLPGMPFNQQMTVPVELSLHHHDGQPILKARPVTQLKQLREGKPAVEISEPTEVDRSRPLGDGLDCFELNIAIAPGASTGFSLDLRGTRLTYDARKKTLACKDVVAPVSLDPKTGLLSLQVLVDRGSIEGFVNGGEQALSIAAVPNEKDRAVQLVPGDGPITVRQATLHRLKSSWEK
jgi:fructan beta-fructosidase